MARWLGWIDIEENPDFEGYGVYKVRLVNSKGFPAAILRFLDNDKDGILQISRSINIKEIKFFRGALEGKQYSHPEGQRLYLVLKYTNFGEIYRGYRLQYSIMKMKNKREATIEQERLQKKDIKTYGETPANNNNLVDKYIDWQSLDYDGCPDL